MKNFNYYILFFVFWIASFCLTLSLQAQNNNALNFKASDFVTLSSDFGNGVDDTAPLNYFTSSNFTIEFWIKASTPSSNQVIVSKWNEADTDNSSFIAQLLPSGKLEFKAKLTNDAISQIQSTRIIADDEWHHVAILVMPWYQVQMYIDGNIDNALNIIEVNINPSFFPLLLGKDVSTPASFKGTLDEFRIWGSHTECQILANINNEIDPLAASNLLAYYTFNQGTALGLNTSETTLLDDSENNRNGILNNFTLDNSISNWVEGNPLISGTTPQEEPHLSLTGNNINIENNNTPTLEDGTDFGIVDGGDTKYYYLKNLGINDLDITTIEIIDITGQFVLSPLSLPLNISSCDYNYIEITFTPNNLYFGTQTATIEITSNDGNIINNTFTFNIQGQGKPIFALEESGTAIATYETIDFGSLDRCATLTKTFTIENAGFSNLIVNRNIEISGNSYFKITRQPTATIIDNIIVSEFDITYTPTKEGTQNATIAIYSNDTGQNPFIFKVEGTGNDPSPLSYSNYDWDLIGNAGFSSSSISNADLKIAQNQTPYLAFQDNSVGGRTSVMKYNGTSWIYVGGTGISTDVAINQSLVITKNGTLYVAYKKNSSDEVLVMKFDGSIWSNIGNFGGTGSLQLALDLEDKLHLAFENELGRAKVIKYNDSDDTWQNLGNNEEGFSSNSVGSISIAINNYGIPYVAFQDQTNQQMYVMSYNEIYGGYWDFIDSQGLPQTSAVPQGITIDNDNKIYVAFRDITDNAIKVIKYDDGWPELGSTSLSIFSNPSVGNILIGVDGTPYLTFSVDNGTASDVVVTKYNQDTGSWETLSTTGKTTFPNNPTIALNTDGEVYVGYSDADNGDKATLKKYIPKASKINVQWNNITIANNDITPDLSDETNFGGVNISVQKTVTYTIKNTGNEVLNISSIDLANEVEFIIVNVPTSIAAFSSATFTITFTPTSAGVFEDVVTISSDNCETPVYTFAIEGTGLAPDIFVEEAISTTEIGYDGTINFGNIQQCDSLEFSVRIKNLGNDVLSINTITSDNPLFSITNFSPSSLAPADEIVFIIKFSPTATTSSVSGYITINSNALNEEDYIFQVIGTGIDTTAPSILPLPSNQNVTANLGCTFINSSSLISDVLATDCNTVTYTYNLNGTPSTNAGTLANQSFDLGTTTVDWTAEDTNSNFTVGAFTITVIDPIKINVQGNNTDIANGSVNPIPTNNTDFGDVDISAQKTITYTIQNTGTTDLTISSIGFTTTPIGFAINNISSLTVSAGGSETFDVTFIPLSITNYSSQIRISNDDCEDGIYLFDIKGSGVQNQEIDITGNGNPIISSNTSLPTLSNHTIFENALVCGNSTSKRTYEIKNVGISNLTVTDITINNTDFTFSNLPTFPLVLIPNATHSFDVIFNPSTIGTQTAIITVTNNDADESSYTFTIQAEGINDTQAPTLIAMQNFTRNTDATTCFYTNRTTNTVEQIPNGIANDNCRVASYEYILSGATLGNFSTLENVKFNAGITTIRWTARDENGATSNPNEFTVTVVDRQNPVIQAPAAITRMSNLYSCSLDSTGINLGTPIVSDNCLVRVFNDAPVKFPIGQTTVIWTAIDSAGNRATANQLVTITEQFFVSPSDSLILVDMYNQMGGQNWIRSWDLNKPVSTWSGINVSCGKIILINLSNNNLTGTLPTSVLNLAQINELNFSLNISGNRLSFESAEDFVGQISNFIYSPQAKIYAPQTETVRQSQSITFNSQTEGNFTVYQWYKNQNRINGATSPTFTITNALPSDAGIYVCEMKNTVANRLILERNPITLTVEGFVNPTDSLALVKIFLETGGTTSWTTLWDLTQPVATWEGITVSGTKVTELDLSSRNLTGTLPNVFDAELFSELRYLSFFGNNLEGEIPATIGTITTLTYLDLDKNNFEGSVPVSFGNLINLQALWLSRNSLTELPNEIGNLKNLKNLYLNSNKFTSLPETIGNLSELLVLNVNDNRLSELPNSITNLRKLVELYANRNFISVLPTGIQNLIALTVFEMNTNNLSSLDVNLVQLTNLKTLRIAENKLEFDDLLPFTTSNFIVFDYAPQAPINEEMDILKPFNSSVTFTTITQGNGNKYQWLQNGNPVSTLQNFTINRVKNTDAGFYTALITNPSLPNLTLQRRSVRLNVECQAGQNFEINQPQQTLFCENQPFVLKLEINENVTIISQIRWKKDGIILAFANEKSYTVTQKGIYTAEILTENGCTLLSNKVEITTLPNPKVIIALENEKILTSTINSQETVSYQWLKDGNIIENEFENAYTPTQTGEYSLLVLTESGCSSVSESIIFTAGDITGINEPKEFRNLAIFPNPNNGTFFIDFGTNSPNREATFILIDAIGRKINLKTEKISSTRYNVKTNNLVGGIYQLQIQTKDGIAFRKFVIEE